MKKFVFLKYLFRDVPSDIFTRKWFEIREKYFDCTSEKIEDICLHI